MAIKKSYIIFLVCSFFISFFVVQTAEACNVALSSSASTNATNIRNCISGFGSSGGEVVLTSSGTYSINSSISINKSNVIIRGQGPSSTTVRWTGTTSSLSYVFGYVGSNAYSNITIKDMKINGENANVIGVYFDGTSSHPISYVTVRNANIVNCGQYGIHMKQTDDIFIRDVDLDHNGHYSGDASRYSLNHALYFRGTDTAFIEYVTATDSAANGFNIAESSNIYFGNVDAISNGQHGIRVEQSDYVRINDSETTGNGENGIEIHPAGAPLCDSYCYDNNDYICVWNTISSANVNYGLYLTYTYYYELYGNTISGNSAGNQVNVAITRSSTSGICGSIPIDPSVWPFTR